MNDQTLQNDNVNNELVVNDNVNNEPVVEPPEAVLRRSQRQRSFDISNDFVVYLQESEIDLGMNNDLVSFSEAIESFDSSNWINAMEDELKFMDKNQV